MGTPAPSTPPPLCVDMDGTLVRTDTLWESILRLLKNNIWGFIRLLASLPRGKAHFKSRIAASANLDPASLPYRSDLLDYIVRERGAGRRIVLATGANERVARSVAAHLGLFDEVLASDASHNLTGTAKQQLLSERYGERGFEYAANSHRDLPVWRHASRALVAGASDGLVRRLRSEDIPIAHVFSDEPNSLQLLARAARVHQWAKNLLIFVPLFLSHKIVHLAYLLPALLAFAIFCCCASGVYILNDLLDLPSDRAHARKRDRPFATGALSIPFGVAMIPLLIGAGLALSLWLPWQFRALLGLYLVLTSVYSLFLKSFALLDVMLLAGLYVLRIFAGGAAEGIEISTWTTGYCLFLFLSLALVKRYVELLMLKAFNGSEAPGRGYSVMDPPMLAAFGAGSGYVAALLLALYIDSREVRLLYQHPEWLWFLCALHVFWISRVWLLANRGQLHHDPIVFALRDRTSYVLGAIAALIGFAAK